MSLSALATELSTDPIGIGYAGKGDADRADILNAATRRGPVPIGSISAQCLKLGLTGGVLALLEIPLGGAIAPGVTMTLQTKGMLHQMLTLIQTDYRLESADVDDPLFGPGCDALIALGVIDAAGKASLLALGANRRSRAQELFGAPVTAADCESARKELA